MLFDIRLGVTADTRTISLWQQSAPSTASRSCALLELPFPKGDKLLLTSLKHLHNVETRFYCPQTFLSLDSQCRDDVSELK